MTYVVAKGIASLIVPGDLLVNVLKPVKVNDNRESDFTFIGLTILISLYAKLGSGHFTVLNFC